MADIQAFRAFRYDLGRVGKLGDVVAPPYDVIDPSLQDALYHKHPNNVIRLILNKQEPGDSETINRYTRAARFLKDWQQDSVLVQDSARSLYAYHQEFEVEGVRRTRKGFLGRVRLERFGESRIYPHEETLPGPKADRLQLFHATGMNLSPIFGLYPDPTFVVQSCLDEAVRRSLPLEAADHLGVINRLWPISDQSLVTKVTGLMSTKPIFIADGHHRYETAQRYLEDKKHSGEVRDTDAAPNFVLMMLVGMCDPGLLILPTHRLLSGLPELSQDRLREFLEMDFAIERKPSRGPKAAREAWNLVQESAEAGSQGLLGFGTSRDGEWCTARFRKPDMMQQLAGDHSPAWQGLGVAILQVVLMGKRLPEVFGVQPTCRYVHLLSEATDAVNRKECDLAVLVPPATMSHVEEIAGHLEKMPPKSTYFYPKLLSGLVFNSLKAN